MSEFLGYLIPGIMTGAVYSLIGLGFVLIYKSSGVLNLAQGELVIFGAYICYTFVGILALPWWLGFILTFICVAITAILIERFTQRPLVGQPLLSLILITLGLGVFLRGVMVLLWGQEYKKLPPMFTGEGVKIFGVEVTTEYLSSLIAAIILFVLLTLFFRYTRWGLAMRAAAEDHQVARSSGISIGTVFSLSWIVSMLVSAIGGIFLTSITSIHYSLIGLGLKSVSVALVGGLESILGSLIAGPLIGAIEFISAGYLDPYVGGGIRDVAAWVILVVVLMIRPYGFFGWKRIERI